MPNCWVFPGLRWAISFITDPKCHSACEKPAMWRPTTHLCRGYMQRIHCKLSLCGNTSKWYCTFKRSWHSLQYYVYKHPRSHVLITTGCGRWCQCKTRVTHALRSCGWLAHEVISAAYVNTHMHWLHCTTAAWLGTENTSSSYCSWQEWEKLHAGSGARVLSELLVHINVSLGSVQG